MEYEKGRFRVVVDEESGDWLIYLSRELFGCLTHDDQEAIFTTDPDEELPPEEAARESLRGWVQESPGLSTRA